MSRQFDPSLQPDSQPENEADDSMQVKRERLGVTDEVASQNISEESRLRYIDRLLHSAPVLAAPVGFAERVIARLKGQGPHSPRYEEGTGIVLGLSFLLLIIFGLGWVLLIGIQIVRSESAREETFSEIGDFVSDATDWLITLPQDSPVLFGAIVILVGGYLVFSGYLVWFWRGLRRSAKQLR